MIQLQPIETVPLTSYEDSFLISELLTTKTTFLSGEPKSGKTLFAVGMVIALINGESDFLGLPINRRLKRVAADKTRQMFYDGSSRSTAAERLRFMYLFFEAHQNSMTFWGRTIASNPEKLRQLSLVAELPYSLGLVVDSDGQPVGDDADVLGEGHQIILQMPEAWGGSDLSDPNAERGSFRLNMNSLNLVMPNGSILNPGAGPLAAIPAGYVQRKFGSSNDELSQMLTFFNAYGAPKEGDSPALPSVLQWAEPALPTPIKRISEAYDAWFNDGESRAATELWMIKMQEAQVQFHEANGRPPTRAEAAELERMVDTQVKAASAVRFALSVFSPVQPRPASALDSYITEAKRLKDQAANENLGYAWAENEFLNRYGEQFIYVFQSQSQRRANLNPSSTTVASLKAYEDLVDGVPPELLPAIVGNEGEGGFSIDAYRWLESRDVPNAFGGGTLVSHKDKSDWMNQAAASAGWRKYSAMMEQLQRVATQNGFTSYEESPELVALKRQGVAELSSEYEEWARQFNTRTETFEQDILPGLRKVADYRKLANDPARSDITVLKQYLAARDQVTALLQQRQALGGAGSIDAAANADIATLFAQVVAELAESNTVFSAYTMPGLVDRDPYYQPEMIGAN